MSEVIRTYSLEAGLLELEDHAIIPMGRTVVFQ